MTEDEMRLAKPHWFQTTNAVQSLAEVNETEAKLEATLAVLRRLKKSLSPAAHWQRKRNEELKRASETGDLSHLSPSTLKKVLD
jgi:hypothetical protein